MLMAQGMICFVVAVVVVVVVVVWIIHTLSVACPPYSVKISAGFLRLRMATQTQDIFIQ